MKIINYLRRVGMIARHPSNRGHLARTISRVARFRMGVARNVPVELTILGGKKLRCYPDSNIARSVAYFGVAPDFASMRFMEQYLRPGDAVLDVGANIGLYSVIAATFVGDGGRVHAFEPVPSTIRRLKENLRINGLESVTIHRCAVGETDGEATITTEFDGTNHLAGRGEGLQIPIRRLDSLFRSESFAFAKFDVEGFEWPAFKGATGPFERKALPVVVFELNGALDRFNLQPKDLLSWLDERGYDVGHYDPDTRLFRVTSEPWDDVFAIHRERLDEVKRRIPGFERVG